MGGAIAPHLRTVSDRFQKMAMMGLLGPPHQHRAEDDIWGSTRTPPTPGTGSIINHFAYDPCHCRGDLHKVAKMRTEAAMTRRHGRSFEARSRRLAGTPSTAPGCPRAYEKSRRLIHAATIAIVLPEHLYVPRELNVQPHARTV